MWELLKSSLMIVWLSGSCLYANPALVEITPQETEIVELTNQERQKAGLNPLVINAQLMKVARDQSALMVQARTLDHTVKGRTLTLRINEVGYTYCNIGENIAQSTYSAKQVVIMWMKSQGHRMNILDSHFKEIGVGISIAPNGDKYYTQVFGAQY